MISAALFLCFAVLFVVGTPVAVALGLAGMPGDLARRSQPPVGADQRLYRHRQVSAARRADVRPGRLDLRPLRRGAAAREFRHRPDRPPPRLARRRHRAGQHVPGRHFRLRPRQRRRGRRRHDGRARPRRLSARLLGQRDRRGGGDRHPDPAVDRADHLQRAGAAGLGAGPVRRRHDPRHPRRARADGADLRHVAQARLRRRREGSAAAAVLALAARGDAGA